MRRSSQASVAIRAVNRRSNQPCRNGNDLTDCDCVLGQVALIFLVADQFGELLADFIPQQFRNSQVSKSEFGRLASRNGNDLTDCDCGLGQVALIFLFAGQFGELLADFVTQQFRNCKVSKSEFGRLAKELQRCITQAAQIVLFAEFSNVAKVLDRALD